MHSVNSDMRVFALLQSQFMDFHEEPKSTRKSSNTTNVHASEYLQGGIQPRCTQCMKVLACFYIPLCKSRKDKSHMLQYFTCLKYII